MFLKRTIPFIIFAVCCALLVSQHYYVSARRASFEADRTRYMSDVLRITEGVSPVLWIDPQYSYISNAKYFDLSGNANHGIQDTVAYQPTVTPPGLSFDGIDDYLDCGNNPSLNLTNAITIETWVKFAALTGDKVIVDKEDEVYNGYFIVQSLTQISMFIGTGSAWAGTLPFDVSTGIWYHMAFTYDRVNLKSYLNGVSIGEPVAETAAIGISPYNLLIGRLTYTESYELRGTIDEVRIYNTALSATQIQALYLAGLPKHRQ